MPLSCDVRQASLGGVCLAVLFAMGCESAPPPDSNANQMVYFDRGTKKAVVYNISTELPALHPGTGKPTLDPASYCPHCKKWYPAPPLEVRERNPKANFCPKGSGEALTLDGPWPNEVL